MKNFLTLLAIVLTSITFGQVDTTKVNTLDEVTITASRFKLESVAAKTIQMDSVKTYHAQETPYFFSTTPSVVTQSDNGTPFGYSYFTLRGMGQNRIIMLTTPHEESMDVERTKIEDQNKDLLTNTDYPAPDAEQQALSNDYSADPYKHAVLQNAYRSDFTVAGGKTPDATTTNDLPMGTTSPMTKVKRPPRPATGANPRG